MSTQTPRVARALALEVLDEFDVASAGVSSRIAAMIHDHAGRQRQAVTTRIVNRIIGNNRTATHAAELEANRLGYEVTLLPSESATTSAEQVGTSLAELMCRQDPSGRKVCLISGGEPVVKLVDAQCRGLGGRNQQLVLAGLIDMLQFVSDAPLLLNQILLSGGTDGEDGPTDAAGGFVDAAVARQMIQQRLDPVDYLQRNDAYNFLRQSGGLIHTGPTHTNVCDVRVALLGDG